MYGKLNSYLSDIDEQAQEMFSRLVKHMAEREGVTEQLKAENGLEWTRRMNNIRACAMELVNEEIIYNLRIVTHITVKFWWVGINSLPVIFCSLICLNKAF